MNLPPMTNVISRNIASIGHDGRSLFVAFHKGGTYVYDGVSPETYGEGIVAPSPGTWHRQKVKGKFPYRKVEQNAERDTQ